MYLSPVKTLLIIRHAKSSWGDVLLNDFDRPLNDRGHNDAPMMAKRLLDKKITIDAFISSPANRAFSTASYFAETYGLKKNAIIRVPALYHAAPPIFFETITAIDNAVVTAAVFSHNPGITAFINELTTVRIDDMPTCGVFAVTMEGSDWKTFRRAEKSFLFFDYPKR